MKEEVPVEHQHFDHSLHTKELLLSDYKIAKSLSGCPKFAQSELAADPDILKIAYWSVLTGLLAQSAWVEKAHFTNPEICHDEYAHQKIMEALNTNQLKHYILCSAFQDELFVKRRINDRSYIYGAYSKIFSSEQWMTTGLAQNKQFVMSLSEQQYSGLSYNSYWLRSPICQDIDILALHSAEAAIGAAEDEPAWLRSPAAQRPSVLNLERAEVAKQCAQNSEWANSVAASSLSNLTNPSWAKVVVELTQHPCWYKKAHAFDMDVLKQDKGKVFANLYQNDNYMAEFLSNGVVMENFLSSEAFIYAIRKNSYESVIDVVFVKCIEAKVRPVNVKVNPESIKTFTDRLKSVYSSYSDCFEHIDLKLKLSGVYISLLDVAQNVLTTNKEYELAKTVEAERDSLVGSIADELNETCIDELNAISINYEGSVLKSLIEGTYSKKVNLKTYDEVPVAETGNEQEFDIIMQY